MPDLKLELNPSLVDCLACPVCGATMEVSEDRKSLLCRGDGRRHLFDGGGSGYVPLSRHGGGGDSKEAVRARSSFLQYGYYDPAARALTELVSAYTPDGGLVLDAGCGEGYYRAYCRGGIPYDGGGSLQIRGRCRRQGLPCPSTLYGGSFFYPVRRG